MSDSDPAGPAEGSGPDDRAGGVGGADSAGHIDLDTLADYAEGLLDDLPANHGQPLAASDVGSHLASCRACRSRLDQLAEVRQALAETPSPPMPEAVAERITSELSVEEGNQAVVSMRRRSKRGTRRHWWTHNWNNWSKQARIGSVAASLVLVVGGVFGVRALTQTVSSESAAGGGETASLMRSPGSDRQGQEGTASSAPRLGERPDQQGATITASGRSYTRQRLAPQASTLLDRETRSTDDSTGADRPSGPGAEAQAGKQVPPPLRALARPSRLERCVERLTGRNDRGRGYGARLLVVDLATYAGKPSAIIVASRNRATSGPVRANVWAVGPSCSTIRARTAITATDR